jgi:hydroxypyruvate isomerase
MRLAANLSFLFADAPFRDRFARARAAGFGVVEYLFPYDFDPADLRAALDENGLTQALFNLSPGNWEAGERGLAALPGREAEFRASVGKAMRYAEELGNRLVHCMAGIVPPGQERAAFEEAYIRNLSYACDAAAGAGITVTIEPINPIDMPGYFLTSMDQASRIIGLVGYANLKIQFDAYHAAMQGRDAASEWRRHRAQIAHVQVAGVPGRNEPDTAEMAALMNTLASDGYDGFVGCEYRPQARTEDGLGWAAPWLSARTVRPRAGKGGSRVP